ncbi:MAG TPA: xanthine dehydrogenase family protein subunit M [Candidatus Acidoferrum sp.]|jgi:carbon-monoxide dehydrogenase medium subunit|nr:xanthine dehydrogenase family protein subunit M [Candidatus Acidoferrum sp.]
MIPVSFDYVRAGSVEEAVQLLEQHGDEAKVLAGGHTLIPMMKLRLAVPATLIDITGIPQLDAIVRTGNRVVIGALATHAALAASEELRQAAPALWDAANQLGDPQVRNRGTIGGASAHGDPAGDYPAVLLALDATFTLVGPGGARELGASEFFLGMCETALGPGEILTRIAFDAAPNSAYTKYAHPASHYAVVGAAVALDLAHETIRSARVALAGISDAAFRAGSAEQGLVGVDVRDGAALKRACNGVASGAEGRSDTFASAAYRAAMAEIFVLRAIERAAAH